MRLLIITTSLGAGGAERALYNLVLHGLNEYYSVHVLSLRDASHYGKLFESNGVNVSCLGLQNPFNFPVAIVKLFLLMRRFKPKLIQGWMYHGNIFALLASCFVLYKVDVVWGIRQSLYDIKKERFFTRAIIKFNSFFSCIVDHIVYNSRLSMKQHHVIGFDPKPSLYVPNGFDMSIWKPKKKTRIDLRLELGIDPSSFVVGYIGRFHPQKNIPMIFDALESLFRSNPKLTLLIIGEGTSSHNSLLSKSYAKLPPKQVVSLGVRYDVEDVIQCFDLLCLTSSWGEGFPNVIGEAMSVGVPCITTNVGDSALAVDGIGWVVEPGDAKSFRSCIELAYQEPREIRKKRSLRAIKKIRDNYQLDSVVKKYIEIYSSIR